jgi:hypothetical protein
VNDHVVDAELTVNVLVLESVLFVEEVLVYYIGS